MKKIVLICLSFYQKAISPYLGVRCRYYPSCSEYTCQAISDRGVFTGMIIGIRRILRCHPLASSGYDPYQSKDPVSRSHSKTFMGQDGLI